MVGGMKKVRSGATCVAVLLSAWLVAAEHVTLASLLTRAGQGAGLAQAGCMSQLVSGTDAQGGSEGCKRGAALIGATAVPSERTCGIGPRAALKVARCWRNWASSARTSASEAGCGAAAPVACQ